VGRTLTGRGVETFVPLKEVLSQWKDRRKWVKKPLFPGYIFVHSPESELWQVAGAKGVVNIVSGGGDSPTPIPDEQVEAVRTVLEKAEEVDPWPYLEVGKRVLVKEGPLIGVEGFIVERKNQRKLIISVDMVGRSVAAEIGTAQVALAEHAT
jgi:transcription antitermination factor NusG